MTAERTPIDRPPERTTIAVAGLGEDASRWLRALRGVEDTSALRFDLSAADDLLQTLARDDIDAIALSGAGADLPNTIKRALMANRHVLVFGPSAIASKQLLALDALARRRARVLLFAPDAFGDERVDFVRKMIGGTHALWRPRYVRSLRTGATGASTDALAIADIALTTALLGGMPARVSAIAPRIDDESGGGDVAMVTLMFDGGPAARIDVSAIEQEHRHDVTIACEGRTVTLDAYDGRTTLEIHASGRSRGRGIGATAGAWAETVTERPPVESQDRLSRAAGAFVRAVRARDVTVSNARQMADAARIWERARESMAQGGPMLEIEPQTEAERPKLKLIVGGGHIDVSHPAPALTIIDGGRPRAPEPLDPDPEPLRSA